MSQFGPSDRPVDLSQTPGSMTPARPQTAGEQAQAETQPPPSQAQGQPAQAGGFDGNQPTIISLLYISSFVFGITGFVAMILAYVWKSQPQADWEVSHYQYHIRTFWQWLILAVVGVILTFVLIGILILIAAWVLVVVRGVLALIKAQAREPMPNPDTWLA